MPPTLLSIGAVIRAHGIRGMLRVRPYDVASELLGELPEVYLDDRGDGRSNRRRPVDLRPPARGPVLYRVRKAAREREEWLVQFVGVDDRDSAELLRGAEVAVPREVLPALDEGEVYLDDLVGCSVYDLAGALLGQVLRVEGSAAQDLLCVAPPPRRDGQAPAPGEALIPFVEPIVVSVDVAARRIVCDPPEGLFDLDAVPAVGDEHESEGEAPGASSSSPASASPSARTRRSKKPRAPR
jgi:16S rRNA processing protein RimM